MAAFVNAGAERSPRRVYASFGNPAVDCAIFHWERGDERSQRLAADRANLSNCPRHNWKTSEMNDLNIEDGLKATMGGEPAPEGKVAAFIVENATCGHCKARIERWTQSQPGVRSAVFDLASKRLTVVSIPGKGPGDLEIVAGLAAEGYPAKRVE
jgi:copper chaperone CopZ